jgi:hypothetical protein
MAGWLETKTTGSAGFFERGQGFLAGLEGPAIGPEGMEGPSTVISLLRLMTVIKNYTNKIFDDTNK